MSDLVAGDQIADYTLRHRLGVGSVGEVWLATTPDAHMVTVKLINAAATENQRHSLQNEVIALQHVQHAHIPALIAHDLAAPRPYLVTAYVEGTPQHEIIASGELWTYALQTRLDSLRALAATLHAVHAQGYLHRDVKPANLIGFTPPHLFDFGIAVPIQDAPQTTHIGTPFYMPPADAPLSFCDHFGFVLVAYETLFGTHAIFMPDEGNLGITHARARTQERLINATWRIPHHLAAHERPADLDGVDFEALSAWFAQAFDWTISADTPITSLAAQLCDQIEAQTGPHLRRQPVMHDTAAPAPLPPTPTHNPSTKPALIRDYGLAMMAIILLIAIILSVANNTLGNI